MTEVFDSIRRDAIAQGKNKEVGCIEDVFEMIDEVVQISVITRSYGLLALEEFVQERAKDTLYAREVELLGMLIVDGTNPELAREVMVNRYWVHEPKGYHALRLFGYIYGMLMVQQGMNPRMIKTMLTSLLEDADVATYEQYFEEHPEIMKSTKWEERYKALRRKTPIEEVVKVDVFTQEEIERLLNPAVDNEDE